MTRTENILEKRKLNMEREPKKYRRARYYDENEEFVYVDKKRHEDFDDIEEKVKERKKRKKSGKMRLWQKIDRKSVV